MHEGAQTVEAKTVATAVALMDGGGAVGVGFGGGGVAIGRHEEWL
jgi:hypothetical protein